MVISKKNPFEYKFFLSMYLFVIYLFFFIKEKQLQE